MPIEFASDSFLGLHLQKPLENPSYDCHRLGRTGLNSHVLSHEILAVAVLQSCLWLKVLVHQHSLKAISNATSYQKS